jgi:DNA repair protein RecN (Recombination protein N)
MLTDMRVRDLAVIADVALHLEPGLNVLTGETGAGKSILVDALALLLGERASADLVRPGADRAVVEAGFDVTGPEAAPIARWCREVGIDLGRPRCGARSGHRGRTARGPTAAAR